MKKHVDQIVTLGPEHRALPPCVDCHTESERSNTLEANNLHAWREGSEDGVASEHLQLDVRIPRVRPNHAASYFGHQGVALGHRPCQQIRTAQETPRNQPARANCITRRMPPSIGSEMMAEPVPQSQIVAVAQLALQALPTGPPSRFREFVFALCISYSAAPLPISDVRDRRAITWNEI